MNKRYSSVFQRLNVMKTALEFFFEYLIQTDNSFLVENRRLFRHMTPTSFLTVPSYTEKTLSVTKSVKQEPVVSSRWRKCIKRIQVFYSKFIHETMKLSIAWNGNVMNDEYHQGLWKKDRTHASSYYHVHMWLEFVIYFVVFV